MLTSFKQYQSFPFARRLIYFATPGLILFFLALPALPQSRPILRAPRRDYFAGKILVLPSPSQAADLTPARMAAEVADHDLIAPSARTLQSARAMREWIERQAIDDIDGLILSWETLASESPVPAIDLLKKIRRRRPAMPIVATVESDGARELLRDRSLGLEAVEAGEDPGALLSLLVTRLVNHRFGLMPAIYPVYSFPGEREDAGTIRRQVSRQIESIGGKEFSPSPEAGRNVDILLFVQLPGTTPAEGQAFLNGIVQTIDRNVRVAVVDLASASSAREALMAALQRRKLLDRLASYAAADPAPSIAHALTQATLFLCSIRFLRDDLERVFRVDRAQISLLLSRYLTDYTWRVEMQPQVAEWSGKKSPALDALERQALARLQAKAEPLFNGQFKRNVHAILLSTGERAQFEIRLMQRLRLRLRRADPPTDRLDAEIRPSIHLVYLGNLPPAESPSAATWELTNDELDRRLADRWERIPWMKFKIDAETVRMTVRVTAAAPFAMLPHAAQGFHLRSRRSRSTRQIEITALTEQGAFYALDKLEEMGYAGLLARDFQLTETPATAERGILDDWQGRWSRRARLDLIAFLGRRRMNRYDLFPDWEIGEANAEALSELRRAAEANFVRLFVAINPGEVGESTSPEQVARWRQRIDWLAGLGITRILLVARGPENSASQLRDYLKEIAPRGELKILSSAPPAFAWPCLAPMEKATQADPAESLIWRPMAQPYSSWPRLATAAEYAWNPVQYQPGEALDRFLAGEDTRAAQAVRAWIAAAGPCDATTIDHELSRPALEAMADSFVGTRSWGLRRGEFKEALRLTKESKSPNKI